MTARKTLSACPVNYRVEAPAPRAGNILVMVWNLFFYSPGSSWQMHFKLREGCVHEYIFVGGNK